ncbi:MAG: PilN domain-containing protein [Gammaproteobacteria bacterium]|nr:PilN domain-containing protein [Gammaproteobacteria bacterium]MCP5138200.1 PilN domain-containing protein [Gammaproteobacteria bacterium]
MPRINLLPWRETRRVEREKQFKIMAAGAVLLGALVSVYGHWMIDGAIEAQRERNAILKKEKARLNGITKAMAELEQKRDDLLSRMAIIERLQRSRSVSVLLFNEIGAVLPSGTFLNSLEMKNELLRVQGRAGSNADVSELMRSLSKSEVVGEPRLLSIVSDDKDHTVDFDLEVVVKGMEMPEPEPAKKSKAKKKPSRKTH